MITCIKFIKGSIAVDAAVSSCFTGESTSTVAQKPCPAGSDSCFKQTYSILGQSAFIKGCTTGCQAGSVNLPGKEHIFIVIYLIKIIYFLNKK